MATATLLLPPRARFGGQRLSPSTARWLGRADQDDAEGDPLARAFDILPRGWPVAAVTRQRDAGDAVGNAWLRADPVFIQPDINGARLLAHGDALQLTARDAAALLPALKPLFGDAGFPIDAPVPSRWYLRLPEGARLPPMADPAQALGADMFDHLPEGNEGRRWRALLSEAQVVLHNHPHNAERTAAGLAPINSLWFWGAGRMPDHVRSDFSQVLSDDDALQAFGAAGGAKSTPLPDRWLSADGNRLVDLRHERDLARLDHDWLASMLADLQARNLDSATLEFADGRRFRLRRNQRWRFWRRPLRSFVASSPATSPA
ncbi:MAG: phosphoglycerate mutase [Lysobacter sp.]